MAKALTKAITNHETTLEIPFDSKTGRPFRIPTGVKKQTINMPWGDFYGNPNDYDFKRQADNWNVIKAALERNGLTTMVMGVKTTKALPSYCAWRDTAVGGGGNLTSFTLVAGTKDGINFVWEKYEGQTAGGGQNHVYARGQKIKTTRFVAMTADEQDEFLMGDKLRAWVAQGLK